MNCWSTHRGVRLLCAVLLLSACDSPAEPTLDPPIDAEPAVNTAPRVHAGPDLQVTLPVKTVWLRGSATDSEANIVSHTWALLSGPLTPSIAEPHWLHTAVHGLEAGRYEFELVARDGGGLEGRDTVVVQVLEPPPPPPPLVEAEIVFDNRAWECDWYCVLLIQDLPVDLSPPSRSDWATRLAVTGVFLRNGNDSTWVEVEPYQDWWAEDPFMWSIYQGALHIFALGTEDALSALTTARVRVTYLRPGA